MSPRLNRHRAALAAAVVAGFSALALTGTAEASSAGYDNGVLTIDADSAGGHVSVTRWNDTQALISTSGGDTMSQPGGCTASGSSWLCPAPDSIVFNGSDAADSFSDFASPYPATVYGNGGDDTLTTGSGDDTIYGGDGSDTITANGGADTVDGEDGNDLLVSGGDGNDDVSGGAGDDGNVQGGPGSDTVDGGPGNDTVYGDNGQGGFLNTDGTDVVEGGDGDDLLYPQGGSNNIVDGGDGNDTVTYASYFGAGPLSVSLDGAANDGPPGADDNVGPFDDVENVTGPDGSADVSLTGDDGPNVLIAGGSANVTIDGAGGDDTIDAMNTGALHRATLSGGDGNDDIEADGAPATIDGGSGNDTILGSSEDDTITGGPGADSIDAAAGNDIIEAVDGEADDVTCSFGADQTDVDTVDTVASDCETVRRTAAPAPGPGGTSSGGSSAPGTLPSTGGSPLGELPVTLAGSTTLKVASHALTLTLANPNQFGVKASAKLAALSGHGAGAAKAKLLAAGSRSIPAHGKAKLKLRLTKAGRALRPRHRTHALLTVVTTGGGHTTVAHKQVVVKR